MSGAVINEAEAQIKRRCRLSDVGAMDNRMPCLLLHVKRDAVVYRCIVVPRLLSVIIDHRFNIRSSINP